MLARLRREFVAIAMLIVGVVLAGVLGASFFSTVLSQRALTSEVLDRVLSGEDWAAVEIGDRSGRRTPDLMYATTVTITWDGTVLEPVSSPASLSDATLSAMVGEVLSSSEDSGESDAYPIAWKRAATGSGWRIAFADTYTRDEMLRSQAVTSLAIFLGSMVAVLVAAHLLSGWALRPVERAWEQQRQFVSDASHELKTPLAVILANSQILEGRADLPDEARRWVRSTSDEAAHMRGLVEDLLALARADEQGASRTVVRQDVDLTELVEGCALEFDPVAFERGCSVECEAEGGVHVSGDEAQLARLVRTLVDNATKYAERGSVVRMRLAREGHRARLTVNNRGDVIAREDLEHLFDRFYRTDRARERSASGGFGLGLAIAKSIAEAHGGKISVSSTREEGTTFTVTL